MCHGHATAFLNSLRSLSDTETAEDYAEQIVGGELAGDRVKPLLSQAQFLGEQIELPVAKAGVVLGDRQMLASTV